MVNLLNDQADPQLLLGRRILVTGAGDGIGKEAALTYARHGAHLFLLGRTRNKLETLAQQIQQETGMTPNVLVFDLASSDPAAYQQLAQTPSLLLAPLDGLLLNAGILGSLGPIAELDPQEWQQVLQINVTSALLLIQALLPSLRLSSSARILFTSSGVGRRGRAHWGAYAVSKFATEGLMQVLAAELADTSIRVNAINPGATRTRMRAQACPDEDPTQRPTPAELMPLYLDLMGPAGDAIHGQSLDAQAVAKR